MKRKKFVYSLAVTSMLLAMLLSAPQALADNGTDSTELRNAVTLENVRAHQAAFQAIANNNGGTRVAGSSGYDESAEYVYNLLDAAGYDVVYQTFDFPYFQQLAPSTFEQTSPNPTSYVEGVDFLTMEYSPSGNVTALVEAVDLLLPPTGGSTSGCEASDFDGFSAGKIALVQRGTCNFSVKAINAEAAGAVGVVIFNEGNTPAREPLFGGTLGGPVVNIPVISVSFALGVSLNDEIVNDLTLHIETTTLSETRQTANVLADTPGGRSDRLVVVGAHLDSVVEGPGINDNGSGSAAILEVALQMAELGIEPQNKVRFAFWGAEESGLLGSIYYVSQLTSREVKDTAANLNFDMIGSPNFVRFVYDGDGSATVLAGPNGSDVIEDIFLDYFASQSLPVEPTEFSGRSDYGPFIEVGIPAGGLFTGAEGIKSAAQALVYGGTAGVAYDPCYHQACDTYANNSDTVLDQNADAIAHSVLAFAMTTSAVNGTGKGKGIGTYSLEYQGNSLIR